MLSDDRTVTMQESVNVNQSQNTSEEMKCQIREYLGQKKFSATNRVAFWNILTTVVFQAFALWTYFCLESSCLFVLLYSLVTVRWFMIYHDCAHFSFWASDNLCIRFGQLLSPIVMTPFTTWRKNHVLHHFSSGDRTSTIYSYNVTIFLTVREYLQLPAWKRHLYRFIRDPWIFFTILPFIRFFILYRFEKGAMMTNVALFIYGSILYWFGGVHLLAMVTLTIAFAATVGVVLFHLHHSYSPTYVNTIPGQYSKFESGLSGSSYIKMPPILKWFTAGSEHHHIHHITSRIPGYNLERAHKEAPPHFWDRIYTFDSFQKIFDSLRNTLWDEERHRFVGFSNIPQQ